MASEPTTAGAGDSTSSVIPKPEKPKTLYRSFKKSLSKGVKGVRASVENMATVVRSGSFRSQSGRRDGKTTAEVAAEVTNEIATGTESASKPVEAPEPVSAQVLPSDSAKDVSDDVKVQDVSGATALDVKPEDVAEDTRTVEDSVRMHAGVITGKFEDGMNTANDAVEQAVDSSNKAADEVSAVVDELVEGVATEARAQEAELQEQKAAAQEAAAAAVADAKEEVAAAAEDVKETAANAVADTEDAAAALVADAKEAAADLKETATAGVAAAVEDGAQAAVEQAAAFGSPVILHEEAASMPEAVEQPAGGAEVSAEQVEEEAGEADEKAPLEEEVTRGLTDADLLTNGVEGASLQAFGSPVVSQVDEHVKAGYAAPVLTDSPQELNKDVRLALNPRPSEEDAVDISVKVVATEPARKSGYKKAMLPGLLAGGLVALVVAARKLAAGGSAPGPPAPVQKKRMAMW